MTGSTIGVCSWSLQVASVPELVGLLGGLGVSVAQIACGDPHHATWEEGDRLPEVARSSGLTFTGAMLGFPGEDYATPDSIRRTGGFGPAGLRAERLERLRWALARTVDLGLADLTLHAGFLPAPGAPGRGDFLGTLARAGALAADAGVTLAFETGQETAELLRDTLDELDNPALMVNFDPANVLLYDKGDPIRAVETLGPRIRSVHAKDATRPAVAGDWGVETPLGDGEVGIPRFLAALRSIGFAGPILIERESGDRAGRLRDIGRGLDLLRQALAG